MACSSTALVNKTPFLPGISLTTGLFPQNNNPVGGYTAGPVTNSVNGFSVDLVATADNTGLAKLKLEAVNEANDRLRIRITDPANKRFEIPNEIVPILSKLRHLDPVG